MGWYWRAHTRCWAPVMPAWASDCPVAQRAQKCTSHQRRGQVSRRPSAMKAPVASFSSSSSSLTAGSARACTRPASLCLESDSWPARLMRPVAVPAAACALAATRHPLRKTGRSNPCSGHSAHTAKPSARAHLGWQCTLHSHGRELHVAALMAACTAAPRTHLALQPGAHHPCTPHPHTPSVLCHALHTVAAGLAAPVRLRPPHARAARTPAVSCPTLRASRCCSAVPASTVSATDRPLTRELASCGGRRGGVSCARSVAAPGGWLPPRLRHPRCSPHSHRTARVLRSPADPGMPA